MADNQTKKRPKPIREIVGDLQDQVEALKSPPVYQSVFQKHVWLIPLLSILGGGLFGFVLPRTIDHFSGDFDSRMDARIEQKLKDHKFEDMSTLIHKMDGELGELSKNFALLLGKALRQSASLSGRDLKKQIPQLADLLRSAQQKRVFIGQETIAALHARLSTISKDDSAAWDTTVDLASYRSAFNESRFLNGPSNGIPITGHSLYLPQQPPGEKLPALSASLTPVAKKDGALYAPIGVDLNPKDTETNLWITLEGGAVLLDGYHVRNAVLKYVHVVYNGGPIYLEKVTFINCRFSIPQSNAGEAFITRSLESNDLTFDTRS